MIGPPAAGLRLQFHAWGANRKPWSSSAGLRLFDWNPLLRAGGEHLEGEGVAARLGNQVRPDAAVGRFRRQRGGVVDQLGDRRFVGALPDAAIIRIATAEVLPGLEAVEVRLAVFDVRSVEGRAAKTACLSRHPRHVLRGALRVGRARQHMDPSGREHRLLPRAHDVDQRRRPGHRDRFTELADRKGRVDGRGEGPRQHDVLADHRVEPIQAEGHRVGPRRQGDDLIVAGAVGDRRPGLLDQGRAARGDGHPGQRAPRHIDDSARNAGLVLGPDRGRASTRTTRQLTAAMELLIIDFPLVEAIGFPFSLGVRRTRHRGANSDMRSGLPRRGLGPLGVFPLLKSLLPVVVAFLLPTTDTLDHRRVGNGTHRHGLFQEPMEELPAMA